MSSLCNRSKHAGMDWCDDAVVKMDTSKILATFVKVPYRLHKMYVRLKSTLWRLYGTPGKTKRALFFAATSRSRLLHDVNNNSIVKC